MKKPTKHKRRERCGKCGQFGHAARAHKKRKRNPLVSALAANFPAALPL